jgi:hypothetical protein
MKSFKSYITESTSDLFKKLDSAIADEYTAIIQYTAGSEYTSDDKIKATAKNHIEPKTIISTQYAILVPQNS